MNSKRLMTFGILIGFLFISITYFGYNNIHTFNLYLVGDKHSDKFFHFWDFQWWPYAILHGLNPFVTYMAWMPTGFNLARTTSMPGIALLAAPLTLILGPIISYNIFILLTPALAAWTIFLLCRYLTQSVVPSIFAGYFYGFSSFMIDHMGGHVFLTASAFLIPLLIYLNLRFLNQEITRLRFVIMSVIFLSLLFLFTLEIFTYYVWWASIGFLLCYVWMKDLRKNLRQLFLLNCLNLLIVSVLVSPYLYYFFAFFNQGIYTQYIKPGENIMVIPFGRSFPASMWQAKTNFYFRMPDDVVGALSPIPEKDEIQGLDFKHPETTSISDFKKYLSYARVDAIVITRSYEKDWSSLLSQLNVKPQKVAGVSIYRMNQLGLNRKFDNL